MDSYVHTSHQLLLWYITSHLFLTKTKIWNS